MEKVAQTIRVEAHDTDLMGTVANGRYFDWLSVGRVNVYRQLDVLRMVNGMPRIGENCGLVLVHIEANFYKPCRFNDVLVLETVISEIRSKAVVFAQRLLKNGEVVADAKATHVCVNADTLRATNLPQELLDSLDARNVGKSLNKYPATGPNQECPK